MKKSILQLKTILSFLSGNPKLYISLKIQIIININQNIIYYIYAETLWGLTITRNVLYSIFVNVSECLTHVDGIIISIITINSQDNKWYAIKHLNFSIHST